MEVSGSKAGKLTYPRSIQMKDQLLMLAIRLQSMFANEEGQDLIEYALVVALIALGATAGMNSLASAINGAFNHVGSLVTTCVDGGPCTN
jgi:pilus assembly protein Flp/PilA